MTIRHESGSVDLTQTETFVDNATHAGEYKAASFSGTINMTAATIENKKLYVRASGDNTLGDAGNTLAIALLYITFDALT